VKGLGQRAKGLGLLSRELREKKQSAKNLVLKVNAKNYYI
jgi:hypothetical protein